ncbi:four helix bundle protein [soil metagenome]
MHNFKQLSVWQKAMGLTVEVYKATMRFPKEEMYGLTSQVRRASISICANIAEGCGRGTDKDFRRFLEIANASAFEVECLLILSQNLEFIDNDRADDLTTRVTEVQKMIFGLIRNLNNNIVSEPEAPYFLPEE